MVNIKSGRPICDAPQKNVFCGPDKYLKLIKHSVSQRSFPIMEDDGYFLLVKSGHGVFTLNGVCFDVEPGSVCWIQCSYVLTIEPTFGETLELWSYVFDYQLSNFLMFSTASQEEQQAVVYGTPVLCPGSKRVSQIHKFFSRLQKVDKHTYFGTSLIKVSLLGQLAMNFAQEAQKTANTCTGSDWPLGWRACMYTAANSTAALEAEDVAETLGTDVPSLNREMRKATGMDFNQNLSRLRCIIAASYFLYENLPLDYVASRSGFKSEVTFYRCFHKTMNMTPREYRDNSLCDTCSSYRGFIMDDIIVDVINYLFTHFSEKISINTLSKALFTSANIIRTRLDSALGLSFKDILDLFRVRHSESLLSSTNMPILDISVMVGYNSDRTFNRIFRSINGILPSEYRQLCKDRREKYHG